MKLIILIIFTLLSHSTYADSHSDKLLSTLSSRLKELGAYNATFNVLVDGEDIGVGEYSVSGDKFYIVMLEKEIYSDGKVQYDINNDECEVVIDNVASNGGDILSNPANAFDELTTYYTHVYSGVKAISTLKYDLIKLKAKESKSAIIDIDLYLDMTSGLPSKIVYKVNDSENIIEIVLKKLEKIDGSDNVEKYKFKRANYKNYEIIDFR